MTDKKLPLDLETVVVRRRIGYFLPTVVEVERLLFIRVPDRTRRVHACLASTFGETRNGRSVRAVDLERDQVVAAHAHAPAAVECCDDSPFELEHRISR